MNVFCSVFEVQFGGKFCNNSFTVVPLPSNFLLVPDGVFVGCCGVLGDPCFGAACNGVLGVSTFCVCPGSGVIKHNTGGDFLKVSNSTSSGGGCPTVTFNLPRVFCDKKLQSSLSAAMIC